MIKPVTAVEPETISDHSIITTEIFTTQPLMDQNYQQFQLQLINLESNNRMIPESLLKKKKKNDYFMLYVAGGLLAATGILILSNNPDNFVSNSTTDAYLGIAIGGTVASGMIIAKFFIDKK
ncbi:MAG: hypothetical protein A2W99_12340 [Bacteroidetes bacterium GWF2_33_16]|nr:MAG: hypothetical protein A2X00_01935 [Bacteroidetes bacterium GWE2_32_14]OFY06482.1 MAG: hypothetical protein A2W99_12340 [Bacteroidetes bacterium GWF2_33_16]